MLTYKRYSFYLLAFVVCFLLYNAAVWKIFTERLLTDRYSEGGDLARMGYVSGSKYYRGNSIDLPRRHLEFEDYKGGPIDVLVIGDSFSNGSNGGENRYYQDYIASLYNLRVLNVKPFIDLDFLTLAACFANNGFLDTVRPRYLIISSTEKFCIERFAKRIDFGTNLSMAKLAAFRQYDFRPFSDENAGDDNQLRFGMINEGNFKFFLYKIFYRYSDHAFFSKTYKKSLYVPLFTVKDGTTLLFYRDDVKNIGYSVQGTMELLNDNLNRLADKLADKGIKLYFMPCVDKYNLYSEFIIDNSYPNSRFFELLRPLPKRYTLIDTKAILLPEVRKGVKDVYYADDTHWSCKASEKIFKSVKFD